jgi:hypothetical protein
MWLLLLFSVNRVNISRCATLFQDCGLQFFIKQSNIILAITKQCARTCDIVQFVTSQLVFVPERRFLAIITILAK